MTGNNTKTHGKCTGESQQEDRRLHRSDADELVFSKQPSAQNRDRCAINNQVIACELGTTSKIDPNSIRLHLSQSQRLVEVKLNANRQLRHLFVMAASQHSPCVLQRLDVRRIWIPLHRFQESPSHSTAIFPCNVSILNISSATIFTYVNQQPHTALVSSFLHPLYIVTNFCSRLQFLPVLSASSPAGPWC